MQKYQLKWPATKKLEKASALSFDDKVKLALAKKDNPTATAKELIVDVLGDRKLPAYYLKSPTQVFRSIKKTFEKVASKGEGKQFDKLVEVGIITVK